MDIVEELRKAALDCEDGERDPLTSKSTWPKEETIEWAAADEIKRLREDLIEAEKYNGYHKQACLEIERLRKRESLIAILDKKIEEQDYKIYQLREALKDIAYMNPSETNASYTMQSTALYAL